MLTLPQEKQRTGMIMLWTCDKGSAHLNMITGLDDINRWSFENDRQAQQSSLTAGVLPAKVLKIVTEKIIAGGQ